LAYSSFCCALSVTFDFLVIVIPFGFSSFYAINLSSFIRPLHTLTQLERVQLLKLMKNANAAVFQKATKLNQQFTQ
ncbi:hypothetical protein, partial [Pseudoalteromonas sp. SR44-5]|uniref:hypothetical protein n=1 Tax=Pseudoalteromonas sp. SR44-5 TaxID=2760934 RepID=UPI001C71AF99